MLVAWRLWGSYGPLALRGGPGWAVAFRALAVLALGAAVSAVFRRFGAARPFAALIALLAVMLAGFQWTESEASETECRVLRERGAVADAVVTE
ncbi:MULTISPECIES: hypothetical protein [Streptomyces]|uniref:hypothetical protein n=1 Tax=Streptomyces TaxID=1883 RepID=UPI00093941BB|nr:hypothetical protein [Streptomyces sp. CB03578]OKI26563.1 hypothetical protein A6A28_16380 [Streptomyces sp. CB03578]